MNYSVQETLKYFKGKNKEVKQGTIETFRAKLQEAGIIGNNHPITEEHLRVFEKIVNEKTDEVTWESLMNKFIAIDLREYIHCEFKWTPRILLTHIIKSIEEKYYTVESMCPKPGNEDWGIMRDCIDNFAELGKGDFLYKGSTSTDVNGVILYKIHTPNNCCYYVIGKLNPHTREEDIHIFYNPYPHFELIQCRHIAEGSCNDGLYKELRNACGAAANGAKSKE